MIETTQFDKIIGCMYMEEYEIELYEKANGICPVAEFLDELESKMWAKVSINIDILAEHNINLREPLVKRRNI